MNRLAVARVGVVLWCAGTALASWDVALYDAAPQARDRLSWAALVYQVPDDGGNLPRGKGVDAKLTHRDLSPTAREYTIAPTRPRRFLVRFDVRRDGWRMGDMRTVWIDIRRAVLLPPKRRPGLPLHTAVQ